VAPAHTDEDAFLSALMVSYVSEKNLDNKNTNYEYDMKVANYFCFPESGIAVALRPGDVLFFNPLHYHCASQRLETYATEKIFLTALYLKNKQITRNDNKILLTERCMSHLSFPS
jgi:ectoine hydroxylase-related dioxygenase (phytanoyl-CoA dioxygenase family)